MSIPMHYLLSIKFLLKGVSIMAGISITNNKLIIKSKAKAKGDDGYKVFSIRLREELYENLTRISDQAGYSRNELISMFLEYACANCEIEEN